MNSDCSKNRDWFSQYCLQCAANVLNRDGKLRFTYETIKHSLDAVEAFHDEQVPQPVVELFRNIVHLVNSRVCQQTFNDNEQHALLLTMLNIHAAFLMVTGLWVEVVKEAETDEYGFEIF